MYADKSGAERWVAPHIVILNCDGTEWTALSSRCFDTPLPGKEYRSSLPKRLGGPRVGLEALGNRKISCACRQFKSDLSVVQLLV